jgi:hypothetical protein
VIVVDTSVWIDVLNDRSTPQADHCVALVEDGQPVALTDVIFAGCTPLRIHTAPA